MKTKVITRLSKYLSICILLLIVCGEIAAHTISDNTLYRSIRLLQISKIAAHKNDFPVVFSLHGAGHRHFKTRFDMVEKEVEEESCCSRKVVDVQIAEWATDNLIVSQILGDSFRSTLQSNHFFSCTSDCRYLVFKVFRI